MRKLILLSAIILLVSSCITPTPIPITLNCPPPVDLPIMSTKQALEMNMLSSGAYRVLILRETLLRQRIETLCAIIESTH